MGIEAGFAFKHLPGAVTVFYIDLGESRGMKRAFDYCRKHNLPYVFRTFGGANAK